MDNENESGSSTTQSWVRRYRNVLLVGLLFVVILVALLVFLFLPQKVSKNGTSGQVIRREDIVDSLHAEDYSKVILNYISTQSQPNGYYQYLAHYDELCVLLNGKTSCPFNGSKVFATTNAWTALAYYSAYAIKEDNDLLLKAQKDIEALRTYCDSHTDECRLVLTQPYLLYEKTSNEIYRNFMLQNTQDILNESSVDVPMVQAIESRELMNYYLLTGDKKYLTASQSRLQKAKNLLSKSAPIYVTKEGQIFRSGACWVTLAQSAQGRSDTNSQELHEAEAFLESTNVYGHANAINLSIELQPCIDTYFELANVTKNYSYTDTGRYLLKNFLESFWDGPSMKKLWGEGGTLSTSSMAQDTPLYKHVNLTDSAYTLYLIYRAKTGL